MHFTPTSAKMRSHNTRQRGRAAINDQQIPLNPSIGSIYCPFFLRDLESKIFPKKHPNQKKKKKKKKFTLEGTHLFQINLWKLYHLNPSKHYKQFSPKKSLSLVSFKSIKSSRLGITLLPWNETLYLLHFPIGKGSRKARAPQLEEIQTSTTKASLFEASSNKEEKE